MTRPRPWIILLGLLLPACGGDEPTPPVQLQLPGDQYYPESVTAAPDGTLYVGSLATGQVVAFAPGETTATVFLPGGDPKGVTGMFADTTSETLFLCAVDITQLLSQTPPSSEVRAYDLKTAELKGTYPFPEPGFCNDFARDNRGPLFITDSLGRIYQLAEGATSLTLWSNDPQLGPSAPTGFGADGLALDGAGNVYVNTFSDGRLIRIPISDDGSAGDAVEIEVSPALSGPDAMRMIGANTLLVVDGNTGQLVRVALSGARGTATVVRDGLNMPTSVAITESTYWVTEGQVGVLFGLVAGPPALPFVVTPVPAPGQAETD
jgi:streptogramin lyase